MKVICTGDKYKRTVSVVPFYCARNRKLGIQFGQDGPNT